MAEIDTIEVLLSRFAAIPGRIAQAVEGQDKEQLRARPVQDEWSIAEVFAHIRASDDIVIPRVYAILAHDIPSLIAYDERRWADVARYIEAEFDTSLRHFTLRRAEVVNVLRHLAPIGWQRIGVHEERGVQTLQDVVSGQVEHEEEHTAQLAVLAHV
jgi:uncharacterized damage-inducible protein DinB